MMTRDEWLKARSKVITSTEVSALFGLSPYVSKFELWHKKKNAQVDDFAASERMKWGTRLQDAIAHGIAEDQGWEVKRWDDFMDIPELRIGSSFDFQAKTHMVPDSLAILEIKNVDSLQFKNWQTGDGTIEAPLHIEMQVQHQMLVSRIPQAYIGALVGGNETHLIYRKADPTIHDAILLEVKDFWQSIDDNKPPAPNFSLDAEFIAKLYGYAEPNKVFDATGNAEIAELVARDALAAQAIKEQQAVRDECKARILTMINDAEKVVGDGWNITAGMTAPTRVEAYERKGFRNFRITRKRASNVT